MCGEYKFIGISFYKIEFNMTYELCFYSESNFGVSSVDF